MARFSPGGDRMSRSGRSLHPVGDKTARARATHAVTNPLGEHPNVRDISHLASTMPTLPGRPAARSHTGERCPYPSSRCAPTRRSGTTCPCRSLPCSPCRVLRAEPGARALSHQAGGPEVRQARHHRAPRLRERAPGQHARRHARPTARREDDHPAGHRQPDTGARHPGRGHGPHQLRAGDDRSEGHHRESRA